MSGEMTMTASKATQTAAETKPRKTRVRKAAATEVNEVTPKRSPSPKLKPKAPIPLPELTQQEVDNLATGAKDESAEHPFNPVAQMLLNAPDKGLYVLRNGDKATCLGYNTNIADVCDLATLAIYKSYTELSATDKVELTVQKLAQAVYNRIIHMDTIKGLVDEGSNNTAVQTT